ncbi:polysaccharide pyruvyl transferase family protein [Paenibacillus mesotrionivorans]|uniref:Polysaccharide pyruvyl transferase family protein n=1 Tax=Paenibacillus mesotrionivorans TaxID=3160968 RepID=A0ACC7NW42_9BACL
MNVGLFTSVYFNNIGNAFIDLGAEATIKKALPEGSGLVKISQCANFAASMGRFFMLKEKPAVNWVWTHTMQKFAHKLHDKSYNAIETLDVFSPVSMVDLDYLIIPGCVLTVPFFTIYGGLLEKKVSQGCKLVFLGVSGNFYTDYEVEFVSRFLEKLKPYAIITRDSIAFSHYNKYSKFVYNGIDNVFFANHLDIPRVKTEFDSYFVVNIEEPKNADKKAKLVEKLREENKNIIFTNHKPFPYTKVSKMVKEGRTIISDYPLDYLLIYRNADTVYSDRVHACIPTLSFGNKAVLLSDSPRRALFGNVGIKEITREPMKVNDLDLLQQKQVDFLTKILTA